MIKIIGGSFIMARQKKPVHRVQMTDGKRNIIRQLLEEYDIETAEGMGNHISLRLLFWQILFTGIVLMRYVIREPGIFLDVKRNFQRIF